MVIQRTKQLICMLSVVVCSLPGVYSAEASVGREQDPAAVMHPAARNEVVYQQLVDAIARQDNSAGVERLLVTLVKMAVHGVTFENAGQKLALEEQQAGQDSKEDGVQEQQAQAESSDSESAQEQAVTAHAQEESEPVEQDAPSSPRVNDVRVNNMSDPSPKETATVEQWYSQLFRNQEESSAEPAIDPLRAGLMITSSVAALTALGFGVSEIVRTLQRAKKAEKPEDVHLWVRGVGMMSYPGQQRVKARKTPGMVRGGVLTALATLVLGVNAWLAYDKAYLAQG